MAVSKFTGKHGVSTYICLVCGKRTRDTGVGEQNAELCAYCYEASGLENSFTDGVISLEQYTTDLAALRKQYRRKGPDAFDPQVVAQIEEEEDFEPTLKVTLVGNARAENTTPRKGTKRTPKQLTVEESAKRRSKRNPEPVIAAGDGKLARKVRVRVGYTFEVEVDSSEPELYMLAEAQLKQALKQFIADNIAQTDPKAAVRFRVDSIW